MSEQKLGSTEYLHDMIEDSEGLPISREEAERMAYFSAKARKEIQHYLAQQEQEGEGSQSN